MFRRFKLKRNYDATGISGIGYVAEGVRFTDGKVVLRWCVGTHRSSGNYDCIDDVVALHGHDGATEIEWVDEEMVSWGR